MPKIPPSPKDGEPDPFPALRAAIADEYEEFKNGWIAWKEEVDRRLGLAGVPETTREAIVRRATDHASHAIGLYFSDQHQRENPADREAIDALVREWELQGLAPDGPASGTNAATQLTPDGQTSHGEMFEWVRRDGETYFFTRPQEQAAVKALWEKKGEWVHEDVVRGKIGAEHVDRFRLRDVFRRDGIPNPAWGTLIENKGRTTRLYRIPRPNPGTGTRNPR